MAKKAVKKKKVVRKARKPSYSEKIEHLRKTNFAMYTVVRYRWWLLLLTLFFTIPNLWVIPFVAAVIGFVKWIEMNQK